MLDGEESQRTESPVVGDQTTQKRVEAALDEVLTVRRAWGYVLIVVAVALAIVLVVATLVQMPAMDMAWWGKADVQVLIVLAAAHVGVTVASVFVIVKLLALGERMALPYSLRHHARWLLGTSDPLRPARKVARDAADLIGRTQGPPP